MPVRVPGGLRPGSPISVAASVMAALECLCPHHRSTDADKDEVVAVTPADETGSAINSSRRNQRAGAQLLTDLGRSDTGVDRIATTGSSWILPRLDLRVSARSQSAGAATSRPLTIEGVILMRRLRIPGAQGAPVTAQSRTTSAGLTIPCACPCTTTLHPRWCC